MNDFQERLASAPTHLAYFTRGGGAVLITQTVGSVLTETDTTLTVATVGSNRFSSDLVKIPRDDVLARKDGGQRISPAEWDEIFRTHGAEQKGF